MKRSFHAIENTSIVFWTFSNPILNDNQLHFPFAFDAEGLLLAMKIFKSNIDNRNETNKLDGNFFSVPLCQEIATNFSKWNEEFRFFYDDSGGKEYLDRRNTLLQMSETQHTKAV